jgi:hypothetical protein
MASTTRKRAMPIVLFLVAIAIAAACASGCKRMDRMNKGWESSFDGLNRTISLYDEHGGLVGRWTAKTDVDMRRQSNVVAFLDSAGHEVRLMGGIVIAQEH